MEFIKNINFNLDKDNVLFLSDESFDLKTTDLSVEKLKKLGIPITCENVDQFILTPSKESFTLLILQSNKLLDIIFFSMLLKTLKPSGRLIVLSKNFEVISDILKLAGFVNISVKEIGISAEKPKYEVGSAAKLTFSSRKVDHPKTAAVWKVDDDDDDFINEDDLLDENDKLKPNLSNLKVCGTTGKRKACKDCSCGLAEELSNTDSQKTQPTEAAKSSCGSCYLGDAFRCSTCPYLGLPAFKEGEKVQLAGGLLKDDL